MRSLTGADDSRLLGMTPAQSCQATTQARPEDYRCQTEGSMLQQPQSASESRVRDGNGLPDPSELRARDQRLEAIKQLIAQFVHALNNSLAPMTGYVALLGEQLGKNGPCIQYLSRLEDSVRKTEDIVRTLVHATHPERQYMPVKADLGAVVRRTTECWAQKLPSWRTIKVSMDLAHGCELTLDEHQWAKAILELLRNAELAMPQGGTLLIRLHKEAISPAESEILGLPAEECWCLVLEDSGCGMACEAVRKAFDPLFTTRHHALTAGLGLFLVHGVVRLHGGQVTLASTPSQGTTVRIWVPVSPSPS
ncbi:MAG: ATP-binding protein [Verrucomicrobiia bacterium]